MSLYNIIAKNSSNSLKATWITGNDRNNLTLNYNKFYDIEVISHTGGEHIQILDSQLEPAPESALRFSAKSIIISTILSDKSNNQTLPDPLANFTYSYYEKISLARYWLPIKN